MATQICRSIRRIQFPQVSVFADEVVHTTDISSPLLILPGPTDRGHILEPGCFVSDFLQFIEVTEFLGAACSIQEEKLMFALELALLPVAIERSHKAHEWRNPGYCADQEVIISSDRIQHESPLRSLAHEYDIADVQLIQFILAGALSLPRRRLLVPRFFVGSPAQPHSRSSAFPDLP
jgi:hypothetical protein